MPETTAGLSGLPEPGRAPAGTVRVRPDGSGGRPRALLQRRPAGPFPQMFSADRHGSRWLACCVLGAWAGAMLPAPAGADGEAEPPARLEPLVVMIAPHGELTDARRVPATVSHFHGGALDLAGVGNTIDLQYSTPGFVFKTNTVLGQPYLRGVGSDIISAGTEPSVATFIDGVYLPRAYDTIVDFLDVERVGVIKGPQGVHLGRNVVGGAVSVHTREPEPEAGGYLDASLGGYRRRQLRGALNLPLSDAAAVRVAGAVSRRDGYVYNPNLGIRTNDEDYHAVRARLRADPSDTLSLLLGVERHRETSSRAMSAQPDPLNGINGGILAGGTAPARPRQVTENVRPGIDTVATRAQLRAHWRPGGFELRSTSAWLRSDADLAVDLDGTDADFSANYPGGGSRTLMQELRASGEAGPWGWVAGGFALDESASQWLDVYLPLSAARNRPEGHVDSRALATFGELSRAFGERWRVLAGARYNHDRRTHDWQRTVTSPLGVTVTSDAGRARWRALTPELGVEFAPTDAAFWYLRLARGYKAGGFNTSTQQDPFGPEYLLAWEAGVKADLPVARTRLAAAAFHYDYRDMQLNTPPAGAPVGTFARVINAARSSVSGVEFDLSLWPLQPLELSAAAVLMDGRFRRFESRDPDNPDRDPDRAGRRLPQAPDVSLNLGAVWHANVDGAALQLALRYRYQSAMYFNIYQDPAVSQGGYGLWDASALLESRARRWYLEVHGRNLSDRLYAQTIMRNDPLTGIKRHWGAPRTWGARLGHRW